MHSESFNSENNLTKSNTKQPHSIFDLPPTIEPQRVQRAKIRDQMIRNYRQRLRDIYHQTDHLVDWSQESTLITPFENTSASLVMRQRTNFQDPNTKITKLKNYGASGTYKSQIEDKVDHHNISQNDSSNIENEILNNQEEEMDSKELINSTDIDISTNPKQFQEEEEETINIEQQ